ncbi:MAG: hypothetical protein EBZ49_17495 [Proteobacteria bacterium]|nr:hypothetical protein [Pseudomonadota bacterium]
MLTLTKLPPFVMSQKPSPPCCQNVIARLSAQNHFDFLPFVVVSQTSKPLFLSVNFYVSFWPMSCRNMVRISPFKNALSYFSGLT